MRWHATAEARTLIALVEAYVRTIGPSAGAQHEILLIGGRTHEIAAAARHVEGAGAAVEVQGQRGRVAVRRQDAADTRSRGALEERHRPERGHDRRLRRDERHTERDDQHVEGQHAERPALPERDVNASEDEDEGPEAEKRQRRWPR